MDSKFYVIDAFAGLQGGQFTFRPIVQILGGKWRVIPDDDQSILSSEKPDGIRVLDVVHPSGKNAVAKFKQKHRLKLLRILYEPFHV